MYGHIYGRQWSCLVNGQNEYVVVYSGTLFCFVNIPENRTKLVLYLKLKFINGSQFSKEKKRLDCLLVLEILKKHCNVLFKHPVVLIVFINRNSIDTTNYICLPALESTTILDLQVVEDVH